MDSRERQGQYVGTSGGFGGIVAIILANIRHLKLIDEDVGAYLKFLLSLKLAYDFALQTTSSLRLRCLPSISNELEAKYVMHVIQGCASLEKYFNLIQQSK